MDPRSDLNVNLEACAPIGPADNIDKEAALALLEAVPDDARITIEGDTYLDDKRICARWTERR